MNEEIHQSLYDLYQSLCPSLQQVYEVPLIRHHQKKSDYLYQLHKPFIEEDQKPQLQSLSIYAHYKLLLSTDNVLLHYHWLEFQTWFAALGMIWKILCIWTFKKRGGTIVWTIHNKLPHDRKFLGGNILLMRWMAQRADKLHVHCNYAADELSDFLSVERSKFVVIPHPEFPVKQMDQQCARNELNQRHKLSISESDTLFLMFGAISAYKQMVEVVELFRNFPGHARLLAAGSIKYGQQSYGEKLIQAIDETPNADIIPHFIADDEVPCFFSAADYVIINNRDFYESGTARLALSYKKHLLAPNRGCLTEETNRSDLTLFESQRELETIINSLIVSDRGAL